MVGAYPYCQAYAARLRRRAVSGEHVDLARTRHGLQLEDAGVFERAFGVDGAEHDLHPDVGRMQSGEVHHHAERRLRDQGLIYTGGRRELVELLSGLARPATMPELIELRPKLTQSSMYRNMTDLEAAGIVQKVIGTDDRTRYELAEALIGHHHHSICVHCGKVDDFVVPPATEHTLESALSDALASAGFRPTGHRLDVVGVCAACD